VKARPFINRSCTALQDFIIDSEVGTSASGISDGEKDEQIRLLSRDATQNNDNSTTECVQEYISLKSVVYGYYVMSIKRQRKSSKRVGTVDPRWLVSKKEAFRHKQPELRFWYRPSCGFQFWLERVFHRENHHDHDTTLTCVLQPRSDPARRSLQEIKRFCGVDRKGCGDAVGGAIFSVMMVPKSLKRTDCALNRYVRIQYQCPPPRLGIGHRSEWQAGIFRLAHLRTQV